MAIVNRDLDPSQQTAALNCPLTNTITGQTYNLCLVPYPSVLTAAQQVVCGASGSPNHSLWIQRFIPGTGLTTISIGNSLVASVFGTSGSQGFSIPSGLTYPLIANDVIMLSTAAANTGAVSVTVTLVVKALQDIKTSFGV